MKFDSHTLPGAIVALAILLCGSLNGDEFEVTRSTIDGGGVIRSTGGDFELSGTIGQPDAGLLSGGAFQLSGGFWFPLSIDDCNSDGWVNLIDYADFDNCLSGPYGGFSKPECSCFDIDNDNDVDMLDVASFQSEFDRQ